MKTEGGKDSPCMGCLGESEAFSVAEQRTLEGETERKMQEERP